jgi:hypothetical protein
MKTVRTDSFEMLRDRASVDPTEPAANPSTASRRRLSLLGFLLLCAGTIGMLCLRNGPQSASASSVSPAYAPPGANGIGSGVSGVEKRTDSLVRDVDKIAEELRLMRATIQVPLNALHRNPFGPSSVGEYTHPTTR